LSRIRSIKPEWLDDELMVTASPEARTLSVALILLADDFGNGRAGRVWLAARVFPGRAVELIDVALHELVSMRYVLLYDVDGQTYYAVRNWEKHQRVDKPGLPKVPGPNLASARHDDGNKPPGESQEFPARLQELPVNPSGSRASSSLSSGSLPSLPDQPNKSGSARARSKLGAKSEHAPFLMHDGWEPPEELLAALGTTYSVPPTRIAQTAAEFRYYWKKRNERRKQAGWERTFSTNIGRMAKDGVLYAGALGVAGAASTPSDEAARRASAAAVEARAKGATP